MSTTEITPDEMFESLTGLEEIAIKTHWGVTVTTLAEDDPLQFLRALIFADQTRQQAGAKHKDVRLQVQQMTLKEAQAYFAESVDEVMPEEPVTASGKDVENVA